MTKSYNHNCVLVIYFRWGLNETTLTAVSFGQSIEETFSPSVLLVSDVSTQPGPSCVTVPDPFEVPDRDAVPDPLEVPDRDAVPDPLDVPDLIAVHDRLEAPDHVVAPDRVSAPDLVAAPDHVAVPDSIAAPDPLEVPDRVAVADPLAAGDPLAVPESSAASAEASDATTDLTAKLQEAFDGLLGGESVGSFEEMAKKEKVVLTFKVKV